MYKYIFNKINQDLVGRKDTNEAVLSISNYNTRII